MEIYKNRYNNFVIKTPNSFFYYYKIGVNENILIDHRRGIIEDEAIFIDFALRPVTLLEIHKHRDEIASLLDKIIGQKYIRAK